MARQCIIYVDDGGVCSQPAGSRSSSTVVCTNRDRDESVGNWFKGPTSKKMSDPTGNGNPGKGLQRLECEDFCDSLITNVTVNVFNGSKYVNYTIQVNKNLKNEVIQIFNEIKNSTDYLANHYNFKAIKGYKYRKAQDKNGNDKENLSFHAYGVALDINGGSLGNPREKDDKTDDTVHIRTGNHPIVKIFNKYGWAWGGNSFGSDFDSMHFQKKLD